MTKPIHVLLSEQIERIDNWVGKIGINSPKEGWHKNDFPFINPADLNIKELSYPFADPPLMPVLIQLEAMGHSSLAARIEKGHLELESASMHLDRLVQEKKNPTDEESFQLAKKFSNVVKKAVFVMELLMETRDLLPTSQTKGKAPLDESSENGSGNEATNENIPKMLPCHREAFNQFNEAKVRSPELNTDSKVYDWLSKNTGDDEKKYILPIKESWLRYLRRARNANREQKNTRRAGRITGGSIVRTNQI